MLPVTTTNTTTMTTQPSLSVRGNFVSRVHALLDLVDRFNPREEEEQKGRQPGIRIPQGQGEILSAHLTTWSRTFVQGMMHQMREEAVTSMERVHELATPYFDQLNEILRDPLLSAAPNSRPVAVQRFVVDGDIWDEAIHARCYVLFRGISPIDGTHMVEHPPIHAFAQAMAAWKITVFAERAGVLPDTEVGAVVIRMPVDRDEAVERAGFKSLGLLLRMRRMREGLEGHLQVVEAHRAENQIILNEAQQRADQHEAHLAEELERLQASQRQHVDRLNGQIEAQEARYRASIAGLEQNIQAAERSNQATAALLRTQLANLRDEQQRTRQALEAEVRAVRQEQEQRVRDLNAQQALIESQHRLQVAQMQTTHSLAVSFLEQDNSTLSGRVRDTQDRLRGAQEVNQRQIQEVQNLRNETQRLRDQVEAERRRADEADDGGFCSLM